MFRIINVLIILIINNIYVRAGVVNTELFRSNPISPEDITILTNSPTFKEKIKSQCLNQTGSNDAYKDVEIALQKFAPSFNEALNMTSINIHFYKSKTELNEFIQKVCKNYQPILQSLFDLTKSMLPCLNKTTSEQFEHTTNFINKYAKFICENDAERITNLINDDGIQCIISKSSSIQTYIIELTSKYKQVVSEQLKQLIGSCDIVKDVEHAIVSELEKCDKSTAADFVSATFAFIQTEAPCKETPIPNA